MFPVSDEDLDPKPHSQTMVAEGIFVIVIILILLLQVIFKVSYKTIWSRSRNSDLRLRGAGAEGNIFGSRNTAYYYQLSSIF